MYCLNNNIFEETRVLYTKNSANHNEARGKKDDLIIISDMHRCNYTCMILVKILCYCVIGNN